MQKRNNIANRASVLLIMMTILLIPLSALVRATKAGDIHPDFHSYLSASSVSVRGLLLQIRTPVYPLLLKFCNVSATDPGVLPSVQCVIYGLCAAIVFQILCQVGFGRLKSLLTLLPFLFSSLLHEYVCVPLPEVPAAGLALLTLGFVIRRSATGITFTNESLIGIFLLCTVLTKPQYVFLCGVSGFALVVLWREQRISLHDGHQKSQWGAVLVALALNAAPLLSYCLLRFIVVGHFGIVSFGGTNVAGLALNPAMFDQETVDALPEGRLKDAGVAILKRRSFLVERSRLDPSFRGDDPNLLLSEVLDPGKFANGGGYDSWSSCYNVSVWDVARPAVAQVLGFKDKLISPEQSQILNQILTELSRHAIGRSPVLYARWVAMAYYYSLERCLRYEKFVARALTILLTSLTLQVICKFLYPRFRSMLHSLGGVCLIFSMIVTSLLFSQKCLSMLYYIWVWIPGTISPLLFPLVTMFFHLFFATSVVISGSSAGTGFCRPGLYVSFCFCACYLCGMLMFALVEVPLDRYLMTVWPMLGSASVLAVLHLNGMFVKQFMQENTRQSFLFMISASNPKKNT